MTALLQPMQSWSLGPHHSTYDRIGMAALIAQVTSYPLLVLYGSKSPKQSTKKIDTQEWEEKDGTFIIFKSHTSPEEEIEKAKASTITGLGLNAYLLLITKLTETKRDPNPIGLLGSLLFMRGYRWLDEKRLPKIQALLKQPEDIIKTESDA